MDLLDVMLKRRSVRRYTDEEIPEEKLNKILQAGMLAPTSRNRKPCSFLLINDKDSLVKLANSKEHGAELLKGAKQAIAVVANPNVSDTWIEDSSIALAFMHLMAAEQDVGSCWVQMHLRKSKDGQWSEELAREILGLDDYFRIVGILALGMADSQPKPHSLDEIDLNDVHILH